LKLEIIYEDEDIVAINKPAGLLVHKTRIDAYETLFALQILRDQIDHWVTPVHRLDKATSGLLIFSKKKEHLPFLKSQFKSKEVDKYYLALCRGIPKVRAGVINYPLSNEYSNAKQEAISEYKLISETELPFDTTGRYPTSRYSLLEVSPKTGRTHQIRKHMAHMRHYIIGDKKHGDNRQNQFFENQFGNRNLLLHSKELRILHPVDQCQIILKAKLPDYFNRIIDKCGLD